VSLGVFICVFRSVFIYAMLAWLKKLRYRAHNTHRGRHPPSTGTMTPKLNNKKDKQLKAAAEAAAAEKKALDKAAQGAPRVAEAAAAHGAPVGEGGAAAAPAALAPTSAVEDTVVDQVDESQDDKPLSELTVAPTGDVDTEVSGEDGQQQESPETQAPDGQQQESPESLYQRAQQESPETQAPEAQQQSPETQAQEACPPPLPTTTPTSRSSL
jgi:hypothetical protein